MSVIHLPYARAPKGLSANDRCHWRTKARSTLEVRQTIVNAALVQRIPVMQRMEVELVWVVGDKRKRDPDNLFPLLKAICDGLGSDRGVSAHLVTDDSPEYMTKHHPRIEYQPGTTPRMEVRITDITHRTDAITTIAETRLT